MTESIEQSIIELDHIEQQRIDDVVFDNWRKYRTMLFNFKSALDLNFHKEYIETIDLISLMNKARIMFNDVEALKAFYDANYELSMVTCLPKKGEEIPV